MIDVFFPLMFKSYNLYNKYLLICKTAPLLIVHPENQNDLAMYTDAIIVMYDAS